MKQGAWICWDPDGKVVYKVVFDKGRKVRVVNDMMDPKMNKPF